MITEKQVVDALRNVVHPEIEGRDLMGLKMIRDVRVDGKNVTLTLVLPFREVPIKDALVEGIRDALSPLGADSVEVNLAEMSQKERAAFMTEAQGGPQPAQSMNKVDRVVAVLSGKGGVGKSSVTALLAVTMNRRGKRVGILDADITGPSQPKMFGLHESPTAGSGGIIPITTKTGIQVMSINLLLPQEDEAVIWRGPLISRAINQFWQDVVWGRLDYLFVDLPPGTSDASLTVMQSIPLNGVVLVTSPQDLAGMVVRKAAKMARHMKVAAFGLVENMSYATCPTCGTRIEVFGPSRAMETANQLGVPLLGRLPLDPELARRCDSGEIEGYAVELFDPIAEKIAGQASAFSSTPTAKTERR
ncbi:MAG: Mrp/NBP35 family ATP-binding protein [Anaerolineales bacterium]|nr:Mrp/NBP35 family ATP-binding protein [Anaerolineales bacterium]